MKYTDILTSKVAPATPAAEAPQEEVTLYDAIMEVLERKQILSSRLRQLEA